VAWPAGRVGGGAYLLALSQERGFRLSYWRKGDAEVDFVVEGHGGPVAIEVKSEPNAGATRGMVAFQSAYPSTRPSSSVRAAYPWSASCLERSTSAPSSC